MTVGDLAKLLNPDPPRSLRQGVVTAVAAPYLSVKWSGSATATPNQRYLASYAPAVNDVVWGIKDGDVALVLGKLA